jgi:hypothetical protein
MILHRKKREVMDYKHIIVVTDQDGNQALYLNGDLQVSDNTIYACDIAEHAGREPINFSHVNVELPEAQLCNDWPDKFEELMKYVLPKE